MSWEMCTSCRKEHKAEFLVVDGFHSITKNPKYICPLCKEKREKNILRTEKERLKRAKKKSKNIFE